MCQMRYRLRASLLSVLVIGRIVQVGLALGDEPTIWDRQIVAQPFDTVPLRQIKIPAWVEDTIGCGYTLSDMDTAARGVTLSEMGFVDPACAGRH